MFVLEAGGRYESRVCSQLLTGQETIAGPSILLFFFPCASCQLQGSGGAPPAPPHTGSRYWSVSWYLLCAPGTVLVGCSIPEELDYLSNLTGLLVSPLVARRISHGGEEERSNLWPPHVQPSLLGVCLLLSLHVTCDLAPSR